jgi:ABC-2 type transport system permease protein
MRLAWEIAKKDLRLRVRDRSVFILGLVAPLTLAFIFNAVLGGAFQETGSVVTIPVGLVDLDRARIGTAFGSLLDQLEEDGLLVVERFDSEESGRSAVEDGSVRAVYVIPPGLSELAGTGQGGTIDVIGHVDAPTAAAVAAAIADRFALGVETVSVAVATGLSVGVLTPAEIPSVVSDPDLAAPAVEVEDITAATRQLNSSTYFVAGLAVYFMFFIAGLGTTSMLEERREGTLARLLAAPLPARSVLIGKGLASLVLGLAAMTVLVIASTLIMGAEWGPPAGVALLVGASVLSAVAIMSVVGGFARTAEQSGNLQSIVGTAFAMLGGTFVPIAQTGGWLSRLSLATPNAWFLRGLADLSTGSVAEALPAAGVLVGMALVVAGLGIPLMGRMVKL